MRLAGLLLACLEVLPGDFGTFGEAERVESLASMPDLRDLTTLLGGAHCVVRRLVRGA
jgi:hypothetical protein